MSEKAELFELNVKRVEPTDGDPQPRIAIPITIFNRAIVDIDSAIVTVFDYDQNPNVHDRVTFGFIRRGDSATRYATLPTGVEMTHSIITAGGEDTPAFGSANNAPRVNIYFE